jgi:hypothetical protein
MTSNDDFESQMAAWKAKNGLASMKETNQDELLMAAEESQAKGKCWCAECDKHMPIREMKLITRSIDSYRQCDEGPTDYISKSNRVRMCPECFEANYGNQPDRPAI